MNYDYSVTKSYDSSDLQTRLLEYAKLQEQMQKIPSVFPIQVSHPQSETTRASWPPRGLHPAIMDMLSSSLKKKVAGTPGLLMSPQELADYLKRSHSPKPDVHTTTQYVRFGGQTTTLSNGMGVGQTHTPPGSASIGGSVYYDGGWTKEEIDKASFKTTSNNVFPTLQVTKEPAWVNGLKNHKGNLY